MEIRGKNTEHKRVNEPRGNQVFINNNVFFVYNRLSYREKEKEVMAKRRFAEIVFANGS